MDDRLASRHFSPLHMLSGSRKHGDGGGGGGVVAVRAGV